MSAFEVLNSLVAQTPTQMQPVLQQIGRMLQSVRDELGAHAGDNVTSFGDVSNRLVQFGDRITNVENGITTINGTLVSISSKLDVTAVSYTHLTLPTILLV